MENKFPLSGVFPPNLEEFTLLASCYLPSNKWVAYLSASDLGSLPQYLADSSFVGAITLIFWNDGDYFWKSPAAIVMLRFTKYFFAEARDRSSCTGRVLPQMRGSSFFRPSTCAEIRVAFTGAVVEGSGFPLQQSQSRDRVQRSKTLPYWASAALLPYGTTHARHSVQHCYE